MDTINIQPKEHEVTSKLAASPRRFDPHDLIADGKLLKLLYTLAETAFLLSVSEKTVRRFLERRLLETSKAIRDKRITRESILTFLKATV